MSDLDSGVDGYLEDSEAVVGDVRRQGAARGVERGALGVRRRRDGGAARRVRRALHHGLPLPGAAA